MENGNSQEIYPALRRDLHFTIQESKEDTYVLEDPLRQKFFRIGLPEYIFLTMLDGKSSLQEISERTNTQLDSEVFDEQHAEVIVQWLTRNQLLANAGEENLVQQLDLEQKAKQQKILSHLNLITIKIPILNPDRILLKITPWLKWLAGPWFAILWLFTIGSALSVLVNHWHDFFKTAGAALSPGNIFFLWLAWFCLKILHEISHALTCYRYHGRVYEAGILLIVFFPLTYINASSSWSFPTRWQRIHTAFAGMYAELFVAAVGVFAWVSNPGTILAILAHNLVIVAGFSSLFFNANPLMKFDGYFILSDSLGIPNLYGRGREVVNNAASYIFFGKWRYIKQFSKQKEIFIACYGVAAFVWRMLVLTILVILVSSTFKGFGILIAIVSVGLLLGLPSYRLFQKLLVLYKEDFTGLKRFGIASTCLLTTVILLLNLSRWETTVTVPAVVEYDNETVVKATAPGFVTDLHVKNGQQVEQKQPLLSLTNDEIAYELAQQRVTADRVELHKRNAMYNEELVTYQVLEKEADVLQQEIARLTEESESLIITAPEDGAVLARRLEQHLGTFLRKGEEVLTIVSENKKKIVASVGHDDIESFRKAQDGQVTIIQQKMVRTPFKGTVDKISPKADVGVPNVALSAAYGGPIAVRQSGASESEDRSAGGQFSFFAPRFQVEVLIQEEQARSLLVGQLITVSVKGDSLSYWQLIKQQLGHYFSQKTEATDRIGF